MNEAEKAWKLWFHFQQVCDFLWERYENEFVEFCVKECARRKTSPAAVAETELPF